MLPSATESLAPVTTTVWATCQFATVKVSDETNSVPSVVSLEVSPIVTLAVGWLAYDLLWESPLARNVAAATALSCVLFLAVVWGLHQVLSARGAYMHVGALLGTMCTRVSRGAS